MKISQMTNDQATDAMIKLAQPVSNILEDEESKPLLEELSKGKEKSTTELVASLLPKFVRFGMSKHRNDLYAIVAALALKPVAEVGKMNFLETVKILRDSFDDDLRDFFK